MYVNYWVVLMPHYYHTIHWTINLIWVLIYVYRRFTSLDRMLHCYGLPAGIDFFCDHQQQNSGRNLPKSPSKELQRAPSVSRKRSSPFSNHMGLSLWWCPHYHLCLCTTFFKIIKKHWFLDEKMGTSNLHRPNGPIQGCIPTWWASYLWRLVDLVFLSGEWSLVFFFPCTWFIWYNQIQSYINGK